MRFCDSDLETDCESSIQTRVRDHFTSIHGTQLVTEQRTSRQLSDRENVDACVVSEFENMAIDDNTDLAPAITNRMTSHPVDATRATPETYTLRTSEPTYTTCATSQRRTSLPVDTMDVTESYILHRIHTFQVTPETNTFVPVNNPEVTSERNTSYYEVPRECHVRNICLSADEGYSSQSVCPTDLEKILSPKSARLSTDMSSRSSVLSSDQRSQNSGDTWSRVLDAYAQDNDGDTFLHLSVINGDITRTEIYISLAPSPDWLNIVNDQRQTALHLAVIVKLEAVARRLMTSGASVDVRDSNGNTPLHVACREGDSNLVKCLLTPVSYLETLVNKYDIPYQRIPQDLDRRNYDGLSCLHLAALNNHVGVMELLLKKGAKVNARDRRSGRSVLHHAVESGNLEMVEFLLKQRKIDINCVTYGGSTPVVLAAGRGYTHIVEYLIANGADCSYLRMRDDTSEEESLE